MTSERCQCGQSAKLCGGWISKDCEASPKVCSKAGCTCSFHAAAPPTKRGRHGFGSRTIWWFSQDEQNLADVWSCVCAFSLQHHPKLQGYSRQAIVRWFAREILIAPAAVSSDAPALLNTPGHFLALLDTASSEETIDIDIHDVMNPGCFALMSALEFEPHEDHISTLAASNVLAAVQGFLGREDRQLSRIELTSRRHSQQDAVDVAVSRGVLADDVLRQHHRPLRDTYLAWNFNRGCPCALWELDDLYECKYFKRRAARELLQEGFLVLVEDPVSIPLDPWVEGPLRRFLAKRSIPDLFDWRTGPRSLPCEGDAYLGGEWLYLPKKGNQEDLLRDLPDTWQEAHHGTTLYHLRRIAVRGFSSGWNATADTPAIYTHPKASAGRCMGYAAYIHLFQDGLYVAIKFRLAVMRHGDELNGRKTTLARGRGVRQWLTYPGCHEVLGFWIHILRQEELYGLYPTQQGVMLNRRWQPELELHPDDTDEEWHERSRRMAVHRAEGRM